MVEKLLRCIQCNQVIPLYGEFIDAGANAHLPGVVWGDDDLKIKEDFFHIHNGHPLEELTVDFDTYISDKPTFELIKVSYFEATNGRERFLIKRSRERFDQSAHYEIIPGKLKISNVACEILEEELRGQISNLNGTSQLTDEEVNYLIKALQEELKNIPPEELFQGIEIVEEVQTPLTLLATFKEKHWQNIIQRLQNYLRQQEFKRILDFLEKNRLLKENAPLFIQMEMSFLHS